MSIMDYFWVTTPEQKAEAISAKLDGITGRRVVGGCDNPGGDMGVTRFDFDGDLHDSVNATMHQYGFQSRTWRSHLWIWR